MERNEETWSDFIDRQGVRKKPWSQIEQPEPVSRDMKLKKSITKAFVAHRGQFQRAEPDYEGIDLQEWLDQWERAVIDGHSRISRAEAVIRWEKEHRKMGYER